MRSLSLVLVLLALPACMSTPEPRAPAPPGQTCATAVALMCDVDRLASLSPDTDPLGVGPKRTAWITEKVDNPDAIELRVLMSVKGTADQGRMLRARAKELGIARCELADALERHDVGGLSP